MRKELESSMYNIDRIGRHEVLMPINHKNYNFLRKEGRKEKKDKGEVNILRPPRLLPAIRRPYLITTWQVN